LWIEKINFGCVSWVLRAVAYGAIDEGVEIYFPVMMLDSESRIKA
jgi:hypothetical protein